MRSLVAIIFLMILTKPVFGQQDSTKTLDDLVVKGFETLKSSLKTPASVGSIKLEEIQRYSNANVLPILNAQAGVRMEERSPGSYRLSLRGSSLRSPFGVRNVKVYWNGIPMSDANGTTYFNLVDFNALGRVEVLKGPSSSVFGAGYGGVVSLNTRRPNQGYVFNVGYGAGSFNTLCGFQNFGFSSDKWSLTLTNSLLKSQGYRHHSEIGSNRTSFSASYNLSKNHSLTLSNVLVSIDYQTPGGLTLTQMTELRTASRPATPTLGSSSSQKAGIIQNFQMHGLTHNWSFSPSGSISSTLFLTNNKLENPFITSYEYRKEKSYGYRVLGRQDFDALSFQLGSEGIFTHSTFDVRENLSGVSGADMYFTDLKSSQVTHFAQVVYALPWQIDLTGGLSFNTQQYTNTTKEFQSSVSVKEKPSVPLTPRIAMLKGLSEKVSIYYSWSSGYSAPTAQEITANYENARGVYLRAEKGMSHELGFKAAWNSWLRSELSLYKQNVRDALIRNVLANGNEYFENTGKVIQNGIEFSNVFSFDAPLKRIRSTVINLNFAYNDFTFGSYLNERKEMKGNILPGTSKINIYLAGRFIHASGVFLNADVNYLSKMPLNSINSLFGEEMLVSNLRIGWKGDLGRRFNLQIYGGAENLLNQEYSLGYDFNAFGARFYNPAPKINFNGGVNLSFKL
jgi:iron complex outermembrane receptor protein